MSTDQQPTVPSSSLKNPLAQRNYSSSDNNEAVADTPAATTTGRTQVPPLEHGVMVYVGNLSLRTKEQGLASFFEPIGKVLKSKIVNFRGYPRKRSAGYGFIAFATVDEVLKATKELDKKELDGREILVQVARSKPRNGPKHRFEAKTDSDHVKSNATPPTRVSQKMSKTIKTAAVQVGADANKDTNDTAPLEDAPVAIDEPIMTRTRHYKKQFYRPRLKKILAPPSQTNIFVSNLPYSATDDTLKDLFKNYQVKSVRIARLPNGRSKGYGFVEVSSQEERSKALESVKNVELDGRLLFIQVGHCHPQTNKKDSGGGEQMDDPAALPDGQEISVKS